jgi:hypothetical protein
MLRGIKFCGALILNIFVAVIGTAVLETSVGKVFHPQSVSAVLWKEWSLSLLCAALLGFAIWRTWRMSASKWTWVIPSLWFGLRFVPASIFTRGSVWSQFSGADCDNGLHAPGCQNFFVFTIPFIRGVSYSVAAQLSSLFSPPTLQSATESAQPSPITPPGA